MKKGIAESCSKSDALHFLLKGKNIVDSPYFFKFLDKAELKYNKQFFLNINVIIHLGEQS